MGKAGNRRRSKRTKQRLKVRFWCEEFEDTGLTTDVSTTGLFLETHHALEVGTRLHLEIAIGEGSHFAEGQVARRKSYPVHARCLFKSGVGIRFVGINEALKAAAAAEEPEETQVLVQAVPDGPMEVDLRDPEVLRAVYERDIKHGGLLVSTSEKPDVNSEVTVPLLLPEPAGKIDCLATVVKVNESPPSVALRLHEIDAVRARVLEVLNGL